MEAYYVRVTGDVGEPPIVWAPSARRACVPALNRVRASHPRAVLPSWKPSQRLPWARVRAWSVRRGAEEAAELWAQPGAVNCPYWADAFGPGAAAPPPVSHDPYWCTEQPW